MAQVSISTLLLKSNWVAYVEASELAPARSASVCFRGMAVAIKCEGSQEQMLGLRGCSIGAGGGRLLLKDGSSYTCLLISILTATLAADSEMKEEGTDLPPGIL